MADPRSPTRADLAKFLPDQRSIRAFEKVFDLIPSDLETLSGRIDILENPPTILVTSDLDLSTEFYAIVVTSDGLTLTMPKCADDIVGRIWTISLFIVGQVTINTQSGDSFPTPDVAAETSLILNRRGSTIGLRCVSDSQWSFV